MKYKQSLTNESLSRQFNSLFELVNYSIKLAYNLVHSGRAPHVSVEEENPAVVVLEEIASGRDILEDLSIEDEKELLEVSSSSSNFVDVKSKKEEESLKPPKKVRKTAKA